jgi:hypothetical protein
LKLHERRRALGAFRKQMILDVVKGNQGALDEICGRVGGKFVDRVELSGSRDISILP